MFWGLDGSWCLQDSEGGYDAAIGVFELTEIRSDQSSLLLTANSRKLGRLTWQKKRAAISVVAIMLGGGSASEHEMVFASRTTANAADCHRVSDPNDIALEVVGALWARDTPALKEDEGISQSE